ncbi:hypothetical protein BN7_3904 [Wickerhamomyces ciferrii]|uniref:Decapping nuclease n=1 Tax=Wickerhamomyces ciferrii (strain ATCC 14091 / BCRC 22168 / CBS 111 / JCM 3599 / NBRC 0793 / NRRL Y-1031 F-60-10) TaxID=1206466 RepID=K0KN02_WICCF|nr:uncharacterized protein BN7_3904 [Wickerhamomyces ciferrii]CCH44341.1 hypothetical protein BN7_3904 [Wickerhamomyces ciferrii]
MSSSKLLPLNSRAATTALKQPKEIASFSRTFDGEYVNDDSSLGYYFLPDSDIETNIDLGAGFKKFKKFDEARDGEFDGLLGAIKNYEETNKTKVKAHIITWRGIMTKLLTLPYNLNDPLDFNVVYFDGHLFIQEDKALKTARETKPTDEHARLMYSGYKFESIATLPKPLAQVSRATIDKNHKKIVSNAEQYCSIVKTGIGKQRIIIGGEVDCVWDYKPEDSNPLPHYVELKTSKVISEPKHSIIFEKKLFRTWAQCFLLGISKVIYGFRDDNLILRTVEQYKVDEIPVLIKNNPVNTNPKRINCIDALKWYGAVVEWIVENVPKDESKAFRISYDNKNKSFALNELPSDVSDNVLSTMLTEDFKNWRLQKRNE